MSTQHTPGPWTVRDNQGEDGSTVFHSILDRDGNYISSTWAGPHQGNANLITSSPSLLADLEEAARVSGARWTMMMRRILLPLTLPAIMAVWIWVVAHCMRELTSALLLQGTENKTVPVLLWGYWSGGEPNKASAVGVWLVVAMLLVVGAWQLMVRRGRLSGVQE